MQMPAMTSEEALEMDKLAASTQTKNRRAGHADHKAHAAAYRLIGPRPRAFFEDGAKA